MRALSMVDEHEERVLRQIAEGNGCFAHSEYDADYAIVRSLQRQRLVIVTGVEIELASESAKATLTEVKFELTDAGLEAFTGEG